MQLSEKTLSILKNFAKFNENILISQGSILKTITNQKNFFGTAKIEEEFPREIGIYNLPEFLNALSLFTNPELDFEDSHVVISDNSGEQIKYFYADKSLLAYPERDIAVPKADVTFNLTSKNLEKALNAARVLNLPNVSLIRENNKLILRAQDSANSTSNKYDVKLGENDGDDFEVHFKMENLRLLELDYDVKVVLKGIAEFRNDTFGVSYVIGLAASKS